MKNIIFIMSMLVSFIANAYEPMIREDRIWEYDYEYSYYSEHGPSIARILHLLRFQGTEVRNNVTYNVLQMKVGDSTVWEDVALMREDTKEGIVYLLLDSESIKYNILGKTKDFPLPENYEIPLYKWNLKEGEIENIAWKGSSLGLYYNDQGDDLMLGSSDFAVFTSYIALSEKRTFNGVERQVTAYNTPDINYFNLYSDYPFAIICVEGVGNVSGGLLHRPLIADICIGCQYRTFRFKRQTDLWGNVIIESPVKWDTNSVESVNVESRPADERKYNLQGVETDRPEPGSIYIQNGEKHVAN